MKTLVNQTPEPVTISINELSGKELICYKCKGSGHTDTVAFLSKMSYYQEPTNTCYTGFGFVYLGYSNTRPSYIAHTWHESIQLAMKSRTLRVFETQKEMLTAILNNEI
jgi:hypothetical protein